MANATVEKDTVDPATAPGTPEYNAANGVATTSAKLPEGFVRLSDVRKKAAAAPSYGVLAQYVGKSISIESIKVDEAGRDKRGKAIYTGTMDFSLFNSDDPEAATLTLTSPIPAAAIGTIVAALQANPDETLVCDVVQTKRGLALR